MESYSAVDGGHRFTFNMGNAPVGSIGKPLAKYRIQTDSGKEASIKEPGELLFEISKNENLLNIIKILKRLKKSQKWLHPYRGYCL